MEYFIKYKLIFERKTSCITSIPKKITNYNLKGIGIFQPYIGLMAQYNIIFFKILYGISN